MKVDIPNFKILETIYESESTLVLKALNKKNNQSCILKTIIGEFPSAVQLSRLKYEANLLSSFDSDSIIKTFGLQEYNHNLALILEDFGGINFAIYKKNQGELSLSELLGFAINITELLTQVHAQNLIHKDINPKNILINPNNQSLKLIDFGISTKLSRQTQEITKAEKLEGTLPYISPEQTGRMNRSIDYRSDFYSLGITLYELFSDQLPFITDDAMEMVHQHIAQDPPRLIDLKPDFPLSLSEIIYKLMHKSPDDRYQSVFGILKDLEKCQETYNQSQNIPIFKLGQFDTASVFMLPQKLYGRDSEITTILETFHKACEGNAQLLLLSGYSGIGKTSVLTEIHKPIFKERGYFIRGKFDQFSRNIPYASIIAAFRDLIRQILTENQDKIDLWKEKILGAMNGNGQIIIEVIPEVEHIIGEQPALPEADVQSVQNRFNLYFEKFIAVFCDRNHPLVMFLDDLQWADIETLKLIQMLLTNTISDYHLYLIGAFRDNEVDQAHPLQLMIQDLKKTKINYHQIQLKPLQTNHIQEMLVDMFHTNEASSAALSQIIYQKTHGNPFFITKLLRSLYQQNHIQFNHEKGHWFWDIESIQKSQISDNVVDLLLNEIESLDDKAKEILKYASCLGNKFDLKSVHLITEEPEEDIIIHIHHAEEKEFVRISGEQYTFCHDRIQQAIYSLIPEIEIPNYHLKIGRALRNNLNTNEISKNIFDVVRQFNESLRLITVEDEKNFVLELNIEAGKKARTSNAYEVAYNLLSTAKTLLPTSPFKADYAHAFPIHLMLAECAYLNGELDEAESLFKDLITNSQSKLDMANVYIIMIILKLTRFKYQEAVKYGHEILGILGVQLPKKMSKLSFIISLIRIKIKLRNKSQTDLLAIQTETDPENQIIWHIIKYASNAIYFLDKPLFALTMLKLLPRALAHGNHESLSTSFMAYAMVLSVKLDRYLEADRICNLSVDFANKSGSPKILGMAYTLYVIFNYHWCHQAMQNHDFIEKALKHTMSSGDFVYIGYAIAAYSFTYQIYAKSISDYHHIIDKYIPLSKKINFDTVVDQFIMAKHVCTWLEADDDLDTYSSFSYKDLRLNNYEDTTTSHIAQMQYHIHLAKIHYISKKYDKARYHTQFADRIREVSSGMLFCVDHYLLHSIIIAATCQKNSISEKKSTIKLLNRNMKLFEKWSKLCPENYLGILFLIKAEKMRLQRNLHQAIDYYRLSLNEANSNAFPYLGSLTYERVALLYEELNDTDLFKLFTTKAYYMYQSWGAKSKCNQMAKEHPFLNDQHKHSISSTTMSTIMQTTTSGFNIDSEAIMKCARVLSGEIQIEVLLKKIITILIENTGAERGILLLKSAEDNEFYVEALKDIRDQNPKVFEHTAVQSSQKLSASIIQYVIRTEKPVVLSDAFQNQQFHSDEYIQKTKAKSILSVPVRHQGKLIAIVYLENTQTTGIFTRERVKTIELLSSQAAIALENATIYEQLEKKVNERTKELHLAKEQAEKANQFKSTFLAQMTHDLRTPLHVVIGILDVLKKYKKVQDDSTMARPLEIALKSGERQLGLVNDILDLSKIEAGKIDVLEEPFVFEELFEGLDEQMGTLLGGKSVKFVLERTPPSTPFLRGGIAPVEQTLAIVSDKKRLQQVITNLLSNSAKFTVEGSINLSVGLPPPLAPPYVIVSKLT